MAVATVIESGKAARQASVELAVSTAAERDAALAGVEKLLGERTDEILEANQADRNGERAAGLTGALRDRLALTPERIEAMRKGVAAVRNLGDPVGEVLEERTLRSGLELSKVRVPLGVVAVAYEARPNVTIDCAALTIKSGNALILRGSSYAEQTNRALAGIVRDALTQAGLPGDAVVLLPSENRDDLNELARADRYVDLMIPRGGEGLKAAIQAVATVPVMYAASGNCHVYVHEDADLEMAADVAFDAKVDRPGVCNAAETLLVHRSIAQEFLPKVLQRLNAAGVELLGDDAVISDSGGTPVAEATDEDFGTEFLDMKLAVAEVDGLEAAIEHIGRYGSGHSEAIITESKDAAARFAARIDAAAVYVNASTRFTDGFEYGMGAEIGNSTQKLHARGPIGVRELTTFKYVVRGTGQTKG